MSAEMATPVMVGSEPVSAETVADVITNRREEFTNTPGPVVVDGIEVPVGWTYLPPGVSRELGADSTFLAYGFGTSTVKRPAFSYEEGGKRFAVHEIKVLGDVEFKAQDANGGCAGKVGKVRLVTSGPILVRKA